MDELKRTNHQRVLRTWAALATAARAASAPAARRDAASSSTGTGSGGGTVFFCTLPMRGTGG